MTLNTFGTVQIGRMVLREDRDITEKMDATSGSVSLSVTGQQSWPGLASQALIEAQMADLAAAGTGQIIPVAFTEKTNLNGYYQLTDYSATQSKYVQDGANIVPWTATLIRLGSETEIDLESRLGGTPVRKNGFTFVNASRWHAPAGGALGYYIGNQTLASVTRVTTEGNIPVYVNISDDAQFPRWSCPVASYGSGRARFISNGLERTGTMITVPATGWEVNNGLVRIKAPTSGGAFEFSIWKTGTWFPKNWDVQVGSPLVSLAPWEVCTVIFNDYHRVTVRLAKTTAVGRATLDITIRRGSRFVELYLQSSTGADMKIVRTIAEAGTFVGTHNYVSATAFDANGNGYMIGSAQPFTADIVNGGISESNLIAMDAMLSSTVAGAPINDLAPALYNQYLGTPSELLLAVLK